MRVWIFLVLLLSIIHKIAIKSKQLLNILYLYYVQLGMQKAEIYGIALLHKKGIAF